MRFPRPDEVTTVPLGGGKATRSRVSIGGLHGEAEGVVLESAFVLDAADPVRGYLLFLTDDVPGEDALSIALLDRALRTLDRARLGGMYVTGAWRDPVIEAPGRLAFDFIDDLRWRVEVLPVPEWRTPFDEERWVRRPIGLRRHFRLTSSPVRTASA